MNKLMNTHIQANSDIYTTVISNIKGKLAGNDYEKFAFLVTCGNQRGKTLNNMVGNDANKLELFQHALMEFVVRYINNPDEFLNPETLDQTKLIDAGTKQQFHYEDTESDES